MSTSDPTALEQLISSLPSGVVVDEPATLENYRFDWSRDEGAGTPLAVVRPQDVYQVQAVLRWASAHHIPVVPRGAGSGLSGGGSAVDAGVVLSMERMRAIEIDTATRVAVVEPGAFNAEVKAAAAAHGLWYPPDPSSYEICSIGGNIATNAGGLCCVKYGVTTDYVLGLDVVLADGTKITLGGKRIKDVAGLSLLKLFVGSEGTLGVITRAILRLIPAQPVRSTLVAAFPTVAAAADAVVAIGATLRASMMELMDSASINAVEDYRPMGLDREAGAMLLAQSDAPGDARALEIAAMEAACELAGAKEVFVTDDADEGELFVAARRAAFPAVEALAPCCWKTLACRSRCCLSCWPVSRTSRRRTTPGARRRPRRGRQHSSPGGLRPRRRGRSRSGLCGLRRDHGAGHLVGRHDHRRARGRARKESCAPPSAGTRRDGAHQNDQERPGPTEHPQPGGDPVTSHSAAVDHHSAGCQIL